MPAQLAPLGRQKFFDNNGNPLALGFVYTYQAGTLIPQASYIDSTLTTQNQNPQQLDFRGEMPLWLDPTLGYKFNVTDQSGNQIPGWPVDNIPGGFGALPISVSLIPTPTNTQTLGNSTHSWANLYLGVNAAPVLDTVSGNLGYYARTAAEIAAGVTPVNFAYAPGWLPRYGAKLDGVTDDTTAINNAVKVAIAGLGFVYHPGGNCVHASQILAGGGWSLLGFDRTACVFTYTGSASASAWRITNNGTSSPTLSPFSGFGKWSVDGVKITTAISSSTAAALEINAVGFAFYDIKPNTWLTGTFKYGLILDGTELAHVHPGVIIDNNGSGTLSNAANVWITNGPDRVIGEITGLSNSIIIEGAQLNIGGTGSFNIIDDGGSNHAIIQNNCNGARIPIRLCAVESFKVLANEMENALAGSATGNANILLINTTGVSATTLTACQGGEIGANFLGADMTAGSSSLVFSGVMHQGITVKENWFRNNNGRVADIDVTKLSNSFCGQNYAGAPGGQHYTGVHNDADGNVLWPPQNGYAGGFAQNAYLWGDTRFRHWFQTGLQLTKIVVPYSASMTFDVRQGNTFQITANNATAFTINIPTGDGVNGNDGTLINVQIRNTGGGALGAVTWAAGFKLAGAWVSPGSGNNRSITFYRDEVTSVWYELYRTAADVPN